MKRYSVTLSANVTREVEIEAESPEEAVRLVKERHDDEGPAVGGKPIRLRPEAVEDVSVLPEDGKWWHVMGACEACSVVLFDTSDYSSEEDGVDLCRACVTKLLAESGADEVEAAGADESGLTGAQ